MLSHYSQFRFGIRNIHIFTGIMLVLLSLGILTSAGASPSAQEAGPWGTWVLESADQFRVAAPPDEAATAAEIAQLIEMAGQRDDAALQQITYWDSGAPAYRWNQAAMNEMLANPARAYRNLALLNAAIYDATLAAQDSQNAYNRPRPSDVDPSLETVIPNPSSPSYPSEHAATAGAASAILAWLYPDKAQMFEDMANEAVQSRLMAGVEYPSDVEAGLALGQQVAELVIARGAADGSDAVWEGSVPEGPGLWTGENPVTPLAGTWDTWVLESGDQFRPPPPLAYDSPELAAEMAELVNFERTPVTDSFARFWEFGAGGRRIFWFWNDILTRLLLASNWGDDPLQAARAYALMNIASHDAYVGCWDAKFAYWAIRPFQLDPEFTTLFTTPNHPSYPSAHSCISTAAAEVLASLFPADAEEVLALAQQATDSRIWAGIHFRSDVVAGIELGENVAEAALARDAEMTGGT